MTKIIHNIETGEVIEVEETAAEKAAAAAQRKESEEIMKQIEAKAAARQAVLDKLGLTAEEIAALLS